MTVTTVSSPAGRAAPAIAGLLVATFFWGSMLPALALLLRRYDPFLLQFLRYGLAVPVLVALVLLLERRWPFSRDLPWLKVTLLGSIGMGAFASGYTFGVLFANPVSAAVVSNFGPLIAAIMARVMERTPFPRGLGLALVLAIGGGVVVVAGAPVAQGQFGFRGGELLLIVSQGLWTWYSMKTQAWLAPLGLTQLRITAVTATVAAVPLALVYAAAVYAGLAPALTAMPPPGDLGQMLWIGVGGVAIAVLFWNIGVARIGVTISTLYLNLVPVFAVLTLAAFGTRIGAWQVLGGLLVIAGVGQMQYRRLRDSRI